MGLFKTLAKIGKAGGGVLAAPATGGASLIPATAALMKGNKSPGILANFKNRISNLPIDSKWTPELVPMPAGTGRRSVVSRSLSDLTQAVKETAKGAVQSNPTLGGRPVIGDSRGGSFGEDVIERTKEVVSEILRGGADRIDPEPEIVSSGVQGIGGISFADWIFFGILTWLGYNVLKS